MILALLLSGCDALDTPAPAPAPAPAPVVGPATLPDVRCELPTRIGKTPAPVTADANITHVRDLLLGVVKRHDLDPGNPWAVVHGILALDPAAPLSNGAPAAEHIFAEYGEWRDVGGKPAVRFPRKRGPIRVEPHTDLVLKALTEGAFPFDRPVTVQGKPATADDLFRHSLWKTWVAGDAVSADGWNDTPWTLQAVAACTPGDLTWTAEGDHAMTLDGYTHAVATKLRAETQFMHDAMAAGEPVQKRKQGIFAYTCGGTHLIMGAVYAVARGHGEPGDRELVAQELPALLWRMDLELKVVDDLLPKHPEYREILLDQRMKFLGHLLETAHKAAAMGVFTPDAAQQATLKRALDELVMTVGSMEQLGLLTDASLAALKAKNEQTYLDYIGDAAHAVRGIDLATGAGSIAY